MSVLLKKQRNEATVIGRLKEVELEEINGREGRVFLKGHATVEVKEKGKTHNIRVQIFENKYKRDGNVSALYTGAKKLTDEYVSIANAEEGQEATLVKITGELDHRAYYDAEGQLREFSNIKGRFYHSLTKEQVIKERGPKAIVNIEAVVDNITEEIKDGLPTGRLIVDLINTDWFGDEPNPNYSPLTPVRAIVDESLADVLEGMYSKGDTGKFTIKVNNYAVEEEIEEDIQKEITGFGNTDELENDKNVTRFESNYEITGGTEPYMDDKAYDDEMLEELNKWKELAKKNLEEGYVPQDKQTNAFEKKEEVDNTISDDDIPDF